MLAEGAGVPLVLISVSLLLVLILSIFYPVLMVVSVIQLVILFIALIFFRDPERQISSGIVSPADGKIIKLDKGALTVYMGIHNVHVNRSPVSGQMISIEHIPGQHRPANVEDCQNNERQTFKIETDYGMVTVTQIAGIIARRTVPYVKKGEHVKKGQRIGMIRFGSRVELKFPRKVSFSVRKGDLVKAGETTLGVWI